MRMNFPIVQNCVWTTPDGGWGAAIVSSVLEPVACRVDIAELPRAEAYELVDEEGVTILKPGESELRFEAKPKTLMLLRPKDGYHRDYIKCRISNVEY